MYLAKLISGHSISYALRKSIKFNDNQYIHRTVFELGSDPREHFEIFEGHIVIFSRQLVAAVEAEISGSGEILLETLLWNFLPEETRTRQEKFQNRNPLFFGKLSQEEKTQIATQIHIFDRRRLYYLRYGAVDQSRLSRLHEKCCRPLINMCRDEKEYYFQTEEMALEPGMYLQYIYAIFNLQKYYTQTFAAWMPEALAKEGLEEYMVKELCSLNKDQNFWAGEKTEKFLHHHLRHYLIMFFDFNPAPRNFFADFARSFMSDHRKFRWPEHKPTTSPEQIADIFGKSYAELKKLDKAQLTKIFRQKAMLLHPDRGGDHEQFIQLTTVYNGLLKMKK